MPEATFKERLICGVSEETYCVSEAKLARLASVMSVALSEAKERIQCRSGRRIKVTTKVASVAASESVPEANSEAMTDSAFSERMPEATLKEGSPRIWCR